MDTDDCDDKAREAFKGKLMFSSYQLYDYVVPVYNSPSLEDVMVASGIMPKKISTNEKGKWYSKNFPIVANSQTDYREDLMKFRDGLRPIPQTNLDVFVDYCLSLLDENGFVK